MRQIKFRRVLVKCGFAGIAVLFLSSLGDHCCQAQQVGAADTTTAIEPARVTAPVRATAGDLDKSFGTGGRVTTDFGAGVVAIQRDGKIVVGGGPEGIFVLARYLPSGALDTTFSGDGKVVTDFSIGGLGVSGGVSAVAIQPDGKIIVAGTVHIGVEGGHDRDYDFALARYMPNGAIDWTFGKSGKVLTNFEAGTCDLCRDASNDHLNSIVLQPDGKILAAGSSHAVNSTGGDFALARYLPNGTLDPTFGGGGLLTTSFSDQYEEIRAIALQPDGKIVVAGYTDPFDFALARYLTNGALDKTFDGDGKLIINIGGNDFASAIVIEPDGKIVVGGSSDISDDEGNGDVGDFVLVRYLPKNGALDSSFGGDGIVTTDFGTGFPEGIGSLAIQGDGKIVAAGYSGASGGVALARYNFAGNLDPSFGIGGRVLTDSSAGAMAIQPKDGRLVVAGGDIKRYHAITCGGFGATLVGTPAADIIVGTAGSDVIRGFGGNDRIYGLGGDDYICGSTGNDILIGGEGDDHLYGNSGDDDLRGGLGFDFCDGGDGIDVASHCETFQNVP